LNAIEATEAVGLAGLADHVGVEFNHGDGKLTAVVTFDEGEVVRRGRVGLGAITDRYVLEVLATLPEGCPVAAEAVDPVQLALVADAAQSLVEIDASGVTRSYRPAIDVLAIVATVASAASGLRRLSHFANDAHRVVVCRNAPTAAMVVRFRELGVGLVVEGTGEVMSPLCRLRRVPDAVYWRLTERLFATATGTPAAVSSMR
jgi:hypothetical protein